MAGKSRYTLPILLICALVAAIGSLAGLTWSARQYELNTLDWRVRFRYQLHSAVGDVPASGRVALVGIDGKSVDPAFSDYSDRWGTGGWLTRDLWVKGVERFSATFKPSVVAYDILFSPYRAGRRDSAVFRHDPVAEVEKQIRQEKRGLTELAAGETFPRLEILDIIDASGNGTFASRFFDVEEARASGEGVPAFVMAYYFTRSSEHNSARWSAAGDNAGIERLKAAAFPPARISGVPDDFPYADNAQLPFDTLLDSPVALGFIDVPRDPDGVIRRLPLVYGFRDPADGKAYFVPSLALQAYLKFRGDPEVRVEFGRGIRILGADFEQEIPIDRHGAFFLNFEAKLADFPQIAYVDLLRAGGANEKAVALLRNKIAVVGVVFTGAADVGPSPIEGHVPFAFIHMTALDDILRNSFLSPPGQAASAALLWLLLMVMGVLNIRGNAGFNLMATGVLWAGYLAAAVGLYVLNVAALPMALPASAMLVAFAGIWLFRYGAEYKARLEIRRKFGAMVSRDVIEYLENHPESFALGGERREATMFFSDVAGFTRVSESLVPSELVKVINAYLTPMSEIILRNKGYLNKFLGDGIMAVWGAPVAMADHAERACAAALEQQRAIADLRPMFQEKFGIDLRVRMGVNSGPVDAGNMGSPDRLEYTVMGDAVNLAARLEPANKDYATEIILGGPTREKLRDRLFAVRLLDKIVVQGKTEPVEIYELMGRDGEVAAEKLKATALYEEGLKLHWQRRWSEALARFDEALKACPEDGPSRALKERVLGYQAEPPAPDWRGEYVREKKS